MELVPDIDRLTQIFSNAVAPSFFLGAIAAFVSLMMSRLAAVNALIKATRALPDQDRSAVGSSMALRPLTRRARLLNDGIILSLGGWVCATLLLAALFASQFFGLKHVYGAGILFFLATLLLGVALFRFAQEAWLAAANWRNSDQGLSAMETIRFTASSLPLMRPRPDVSLGPCARSWLGIAGPSYSDDGFSDARLLASTSSTSWMMIQIFPTTSMRGSRVRAAPGYICSTERTGKLLGRNDE